MAKQYAHTIRNTESGWNYTGPAQTRRKAAAAAAQAMNDNVNPQARPSRGEMFTELLNGPAPQTVIRAAGYETWIEEAK